MPFSSAYRRFLFSSAFLLVSVCGGCAVEASKTEAATASKPTETAAAARSAAIKIEPNSPADTVRVFYKNLRERKFREAIFLTNLRPAVEGLTDTELKEFQVDFEAIARNVPAEVEINGEIVSGEKATVTAKLPGEDPAKPEIQEIRLRKDGQVWVILTVDETAEKTIRQEGRNYFYSLRIESHEDDAREMLDRVAKAQLVYSAQNKGVYGDIESLVGGGLLPPDIKSGDSTGYVYRISLSADKKSYSAKAVPVVYGKTGRLSFFVDLEGGAMARLTSKDDPKAKPE
jgi:hypothetical protein